MKCVQNRTNKYIIHVCKGSKGYCYTFILYSVKNFIDKDYTHLCNYEICKSEILIQAPIVVTNRTTTKE